jgi:membrane protein DedA with SNARE-associated domain/rhodanese-related sulfurtransferase
MDTLLKGIAEHGYSLLFAAVFLESIGIPVPAALALLIAGGASARGDLNTVAALGCAVSAMLVGDIIMFLVGRLTGWWLLGLLCRISLNPESCILSSAASFYHRGRTVLIFAKFIPGINTMAPPLAGSMNMRPIQFLALDGTGATLYVGTYFTVGYLFSDLIGSITNGYHKFGEVMAGVLMVAAAGYVGYLIWMWMKGRRLRSVPMVSPSDAARALSSEGAVIYDVRSHGYYDRDAVRIPGSKRLEPNAIHQFDEHVEAGKLIFLYCTCVREATSARVAEALREKGVNSVVIEGGLRAWIKAGLPTEVVPIEEIISLPSFR